MPETPYTTYGASVTAPELERFLDHVLDVNLQAEADGRRKFPVCIWGAHGIGKTEIVRDYARRRNWLFVYIAPAQFEEMGDLLGMPQVATLEGRQVTVFRPPAWVPAVEGPGILLIDDVNRADDRILRGMMQLLLDFRLTSWSLPSRWQIVLTANPEGGDYSVTPMDEALLTRLRHVTLVFDLNAWARWADGAGIDPRGITFALSHPDTLTGRRTTPRTLVQFFDAIRNMEEFAGALPLIKTLGQASLDEETAAAFVSFVEQQGHRLPGPLDLLEATDFERQVRQPLEKQIRRAVLRVDLLAALITRLVHHLTAGSYSPSPRHLANLKAFLQLDLLPADLRLYLARELAGAGKPELHTLLADPELALLLLE